MIGAIGSRAGSRVVGHTEYVIMKAMAKREQNPSAASLKAIPPIDDSRYGPPRRNSFAARISRYGYTYPQPEPSPQSLRDIPPVDVRVKGARNPYAARIQASGYTLQVGRRRPAKPSGATETKSVRLPPRMWRELRNKARAAGISLHALIRRAIARELP